jgi:hypothetical protein
VIHEHSSNFPRVRRTERINPISALWKSQSNPAGFASWNQDWPRTIQQRFAASALPNASRYPKSLEYALEQRRR